MKTYVITGGAGFIGANYAARLLRRGDAVVIYDNLSRKSGRQNLDWLRAQFSGRALQFIEGDIRDQALLSEALAGVDVLVHLAAQVAVTNSVADPREDFEINALGTFNVLEAARLSGRCPTVIYASTNKVYGAMTDIEAIEDPGRYRYRSLPHGVSERQPLDFHSPYGCSKGTGDQYARDYARIFGLPTVVLRQSCIYGPHQYGVEDQGWLAWFIYCALQDRLITIFGDGKQVRDLLYIDDLLDVYDRAVERISRTAGQVYNIGGGVEHTLAVWAELRAILERLLARPIKVQHSEWRPGDQRVYVSDIAKAGRDLDWRPKVSVQQGIERLFRWVKENHAPI